MPKTCADEKTASLKYGAKKLDIHMQIMKLYPSFHPTKIISVNQRPQFKAWNSESMRDRLFNIQAQISFYKRFQKLKKQKQELMNCTELTHKKLHIPESVVVKRQPDMITRFFFSSNGLTEPEVVFSLHLPQFVWHTYKASHSGMLRQRRRLCQWNPSLPMVTRL